MTLACKVISFWFLARGYDTPPHNEWWQKDGDDDNEKNEKEIKYYNIWQRRATIPWAEATTGELSGRFRLNAESVCEDFSFVYILKFNYM